MQNNNLDPNSNEAKILKIVQDKGVEIYTKKTFSPLIMDYFPNDDFGRLLTVIIEKKGAAYIYKLKDYPANEIQINYVKILDKLARDTFIAKEILAPAVELLCFGLGFDIQSVIQPPASPLSDFEIKDGVLISYIGDGGDVVIPNSVTSIAEWGFKFHGGVTKVTIPNSVTEIGDGVFCNCVNINKITIPNSVKLIGINAFFDTHWFDNLSEKFNIVGDSILIKYVGDESHVTIPNSVKLITCGAFMNCNSISQITIPNSVSLISDGAFAECKSLKQVTIPNSVTSIMYGAFMNCTSLTQINIPNSVTFIENGAFDGCNSLPEDLVQQIKQLNPLAFGDN